MLFPTPPLPESTRTLCFTAVRRRRAMADIDGSGGAVVPDVQAFWLGQPAHVSAFPAVEEAGPGQAGGASAGMSVAFIAR